MTTHHVSLKWQLGNNSFTYETYPREHTIQFAGGTEIKSSAPVAYLGSDKLPNPEELLIASVASCYFLTFLAISSKMGFAIAEYNDEPVGTLDKNAQGNMAVTEIQLQPKITFTGDKQPDEKTLKMIHEKAHKNCFITNSVVTEVKVKY